jgi:predicted nucleotide-binding protein
MEIPILASNPVEELTEARDKLLRFAETYDSSPETAALNAVWRRAAEIGKSSCGSWPAGAHFNVEYGTAGGYRDWVEHTGQEVFDFIVDASARLALEAAEQEAEKGLALVNSVKSDASSILTVYLSEHEDTFVRRIADEIESIKVLNAAEIANDRSPKRQVITQDMRAVQQGTWAPAHIKVQARVTAAHQPAAHSRELAAKLDKLAAHMLRVAKKEVRAARVGTNVFIGHGRSPVWRDLKDFVKDRLRLPYDEFNRVPVAGITNIARLSEMLDAAACAFIIMTAEDEQADGTLQARMNVVHEAGLFQGRLGFTKAIILIEESCEEFSNIQGLGQIRFPKGNVSAKFEEIRQVLEREGVMDGPG